MNVTFLKIGIEKHKMCAQFVVIEQPNRMNEKERKKEEDEKSSIKSISNLIQMDLTGEKKKNTQKSSIKKPIATIS